MVRFIPRSETRFPGFVVGIRKSGHRQFSRSPFEAHRRFAALRLVSSRSVYCNAANHTHHMAVGSGFAGYHAIRRSGFLAESGRRRVVATGGAISRIGGEAVSAVASVVGFLSTKQRLSKRTNIQTTSPGQTLAQDPCNGADVSRT